MRPDDFSRLINSAQAHRMSGTTLDLAGRYLDLMRKAKSMRTHQVLVPLFKRWRMQRLERKADEVRKQAAEVWGELYLRFRPVISNVFERVRVLHGGVYSDTDFFIRVVMALEEEIERDASNDCFAAVLFNALEDAAAPHANAIQVLRPKVHVRAVVDSCMDDAAVKTLLLLGYLRGELARKGGHVVPAMSDLEFDELELACEAVAHCLRGWGDALDQHTAEVLRGRALNVAKPGQVVLAWIQ